MSTKMAVAFANISMAKVETEILNQSALTRLETIHSRRRLFSGTQPGKRLQSSFNKLKNTIKLSGLG